jgi:radical SAM protein with 4Fe4S-binding SPASM domain
MGSRFDLMKALNGKKIILQILTNDYSIMTMPQWISLGSTCSCNLQCPHCYTHGTKERHRQYNVNSWPTDMLKRVAKEILPTALSVSLTVNGEPLMTRDFAEVIGEFSHYGVKLDIATNGTLLSNRNIAALIKSATHIAVSIDGATKLTFEAIRKGAKFEKVLNNVRVLTMATEVSGNATSINIVLACTLMGSNIRDLPEIVRLAKLLGIRHISFFPLVVFFNHVRNEVLSVHKSSYNLFRQQTEDEARRHGITISGLQPPFPDATASPEAFLPLPDMIVGALEEEYYRKLPPLESFLDQTAIKARVDQVLTMIEKARTEQTDGMKPDWDQELDQVAIKSDEILVDGLNDLLEKGELLSSRQYPYCQYLHNRTYVTLEGVVYPCCLSPSIAGFGNVKQNTIREIWNGEQYNRFRQEFYSSNPPDCCKDCRYRILLSGREFYSQLSSTLL